MRPIRIQIKIYDKEGGRIFAKDVFTPDFVSADDALKWANQLCDNLWREWRRDEDIPAE